ncbi:RNA polymerase sigma factor [Sediminibacterium ginsengisoli]|uniref:RNA polymerase sigma-70 factor, ECF subfamily n=1 Tax=Sediminibacterium ginsengisoli TaxID=413434 RepID=A0A1T4RQK4_9BACT|nr:sigma-70 family RNA polymerase sigma factor [Sediminibacterium ginsengisoli]SKA18244.1 RNA polymerase sigma-70 factor, ECF subfamily [Sediminibacterium ginsengisoli]
MKQPHETAFLQLINEHSGIIHKISRLYRDNTQDREDLFQEIIFQLWKSYPSFRGDSGTGTWLYRIALNTAIGSFRRKKVEIQYAESVPDVADLLPGQEADPRQERLFAALMQCDAAEKAIISLYLEGLNYQQIAEISGITENYVGVKLNRIKTKIQKLIR